MQVQNNQHIKLDNSLTTPQQRIQLINKIIDSTPSQKLTPAYLKIMADYIISAMSKEQKKTKTINTTNRMITINKRETSFQGLAEKFQSGEDGLYNFITEDKNILLTQKISITEEDINTIPALKKLREAISAVEKETKEARGKRKFLLKKQLIEMRQDQYIIKNSFKPTIHYLNAIKNFNNISFNEHIILNTKGELEDQSLLSFLNPKHLSVLLCNYSKMKEECWGKFYTDGYYLMEDLDNLIEKTLKINHPIYYSLLIYKIDGKQNKDIKQLLKQQYNTTYSIEYISALWRNKIPKLLADQAKKDYLEWYFTEKEKGKWKKCSRCNQIKLAHNIFFSKNSSSKDGFYSICKSCRNKKKNSTSSHIIKRISYQKT